jgi:DNA repair protein RecN (Recombination protein N)
VLLHLAVRDLAIVDNLELDLDPGMTVLTGETGAGKSLLVDALELALGERARAGLPRPGARAAEVSALFAPGPEVARWLAEQQLESGDDCVLRRVVSADGRSRAFINGRPVPVGQLKTLGEQLVDVHGQHAHQSLLQPTVQRAVLDEHAGHREQLRELGTIHRRLRNLEQDITVLEGDGSDGESRLDYLRFQIEELEAQVLDADDLRNLQEQHRRLAHAAELLAAVEAARAALDGSADASGARDGVGRALRGLRQVARLDPGLDEPVALLSQCAALADDAGDALRRYADRLELDEERMARLDATLQSLNDLTRKHRCTMEELAQHLDALRAEATRIADSGQRLDRARAEHAGLDATYREAAAALHRGRLDAAEGLAAAVGGTLASLGMEGATIRFDVVHAPDGTATTHGLDSVTLRVATNPGQEPRALSRVASGGELSRIALALHGATSAAAPVETLVFDEVDSGIGGAVAEIVGRRLRDLGTHRQVLAVTHLPQVAALAHHQIRISKQAGPGGSRGAARVLTAEERVEELARMLGGVAITERTRAHAREMLAVGRPAVQEPRARTPAA